MIQPFYRGYSTALRARPSWAERCRQTGLQHLSSGFHLWSGFPLQTFWLPILSLGYVNFRLNFPSHLKLNIFQSALVNSPLKLVQHPLLLSYSVRHTSCPCSYLLLTPSVPWRLCFFIDSLLLLSAHHCCCSSESCHRSPEHYCNAFSACLVISTWLQTASLEL